MKNKIQMGCLARYVNPYKTECDFLRKHQFDFFQLWFDENGLSMFEGETKQDILDERCECIVHAVVNIYHMQDYLDMLMLTLELDQTDLIIHPVCDLSQLNESSIDVMIEQLKPIVLKANEMGITIHLENNSRLTPIFATLEEYEKVFDEIADLEFLVDLAHIDDVETLQKMLAIKYPKILHIADRRLEVVHEHLKLGEGDFDFKKAFETVLKHFQGKIILEIVKDQDLIDSRETLIELLESR